MDVFSHGLWSSVLAQAVNKKKKERKLNPWLAAWWGVFPDVFAFTILFGWTFWQNIFGSGVSFHPAEAEPAVRDTLPIFRLTAFLYQLSHSLIIFLIALVVIVLVRHFFSGRRALSPPLPAGEGRARARSAWHTFIPWEMTAWLLHILSDIPTHSYKFYPTPFLWPISEWKFNGFSWGQWWFLLLNYSLLIIVFLLVRRKRIETPQTKNEN